MGTSCCSTNQTEEEKNKTEIHNLKQSFKSRKSNTDYNAFISSSKEKDNDDNLKTIINNSNNNEDYEDNENLFTLNNWPMTKHITSPQGNQNETCLKLTINSMEYTNQEEIFIKKTEKNKKTFFGFTNSIPNSDLNDILLPGLKNDQIYKTNRQFYIYFSSETQRFMVKDLGNGIGVFIKIKKKQKIEENTMINIGDSYIVINKNPNEHENGNVSLTLNAFTGILKYEPYVIDSNSVNNISIGRSLDCSLSLNDPLLSRVHCLIIYENNDFYLYDGVVNEERSTNGVWVYPSCETCFGEGDFLKVNSLVIKVSEV